ncbi:MAG TPA: glycerate kinase [Terrimesophilobacter sp.]|nr:glycerate kinase [Terrimesophilobacter sp.]
MPKHVVVAPDSFKGSLAAHEVAAAIARGWRSVRPDDVVTLLPQADGGEGTLEAIAAAIPDAVLHEVGPVTGPDGRATQGAWLELPDRIGVVELAQCSGLPLMAGPDPLGATTRGLGEVIPHALDHGIDSLVIGLGGSASTDGGVGALRALGLELFDEDDVPLPDGGGALARLVRVDTGALLPPPSGGVTLLVDVTAPLLGPQGAAVVFAPQKGAGAAEIRTLEAGLARLAAVLGGDPDRSGAGAAGGTAYGFVEAWGARIEPGAGHVQRVTGLTGVIRSADVVLTGEGRFDATSSTGKVVGELLGLAAQNHVPVGVIAGQITAETEGWSISLADLAGSAEAAIADPVRYLERAGGDAARYFAAG